MSEANKHIVLRFDEEVWEKRNLDVLDELVAEDFVYHNPSLPVPDIPGRTAFKALLTGLLKAFPDLRTAADDVIAEGDRVVGRVTFSGTHKGDFMGVPATGKSVTWSAIVILRIADGKICEEWINADLLGLMRQLGAVPEVK
jgi:steroid delta-isomerase-like uncharacterized protein